MDPNLTAARAAIDAAEAQHETDLAAAQDQITELRDHLIDLEEHVDGLSAALTAEQERRTAAEQALRALRDLLRPTVIGTSFAEPVPAGHAVGGARIYFSPNKIAASWLDKDTIRQASARAVDTFLLSVKPQVGRSTLTDTELATLVGLFESVPAGVGLYVTYYHEHDGNLRKGDLSLAGYRESSSAVSDLARSHGHKYGPIHNGMVTHGYGAGDWGYFADVWAANEADLTLYDFWGFDGYAANYEDPAVLYAPAAAYADALGLPLVVGELAAPNGPRQAAWAALAREWALSECDAALWWNQIKDGKDWTLTDEAAAAWFGTTRH